MNSNNPSNPHALLSLLNRDQYGNRPLIYGPYYSAMPESMIELNNDVTSDDQYLPTGNYKSKTMTWLNPETGMYEEREIFDDYVYPSEANSLFPRMWWHSRAKQYEAEWVTLKDGHPQKRCRMATATHGTSPQQARMWPTSWTTSLAICTSVTSCGTS